MEGLEQVKVATIEKAPEKAKVRFNHINFNKEHPSSPDVRVVVEKQPIVIENGKSYPDGTLQIDEHNPQLHDLNEIAAKIKELPEEQRASAVLKFLRDHVQYAYKDVLEQLAAANPERAKWVASNTSLDSRKKDVLLSEFLENGYGICTHLSAAYLYFAEKAGLKGCFMSSTPGRIKNVLKPDGEKLFRSTEVGEPVSGHSWVEVKLSDDTWIPIDPTTQLVGDTPENLQVFRDANYIAHGWGIEVSSDVAELRAEGIPPQFLPGAARAETSYKLYLKSARQVLGSKEPPSNEPFSGSPKMEVSTEREIRGMKLSLVDVRV